MIVGIAGSHRTGKTTLASAFAEAYKGVAVQTSVGAIFGELGLNPALPMNVDVRLTIQNFILDKIEQALRRCSCDEKRLYVFDRTPVDMIAYTLAEFNGLNKLTTAQTERLNEYIERCFEVANRYFAMIVMVRPGIEVVEAELKASTCHGVIAKIGYLIDGISHDMRLSVPSYFIPRSCLNLEERVAAMTNGLKRTYDMAQSELTLLAAKGLSIH